jgi:serine/threonine-protein kinase
MSDLVGKSVGQYRIESLLGRGGMSDVYLATHETSRRRVALKLVRLADITNGERRFLSEAQLLSNLDHPDIVRLYDFFESQGMLALAIEYVPGRGLDEILEEKPLTPKEAMDMFGKILQPISYLHDRGIVHRDIKPSNIHVMPSGDIKLLDFGIARETSSKRMTRVGRVVGTPGYISPEVRAGGEPTPCADVYALGLLLREMIDGPVERQAQTKQTLVARVIGPERPPEEKFLRKIIAKCSQRDPANRYPSAHALLREWEVGRLEASVGPVFPARTLAIAAGVVVFLAVVVIAWPKSDSTPPTTSTSGGAVSSTTTSTGLNVAPPPGPLSTNGDGAVPQANSLVPVTISTFGNQPADVYVDGTLKGHTGEQPAVIQVSQGQHTFELRSGDKSVTQQISVSPINNNFQMVLN